MYLPVYPCGGAPGSKNMFPFELKVTNGGVDHETDSRREVYYALRLSRRLQNRVGEFRTLRTIDFSFPYFYGTLYGTPTAASRRELPGSYNPIFQG